MKRALVLVAITSGGCLLDPPTADGSLRDWNVSVDSPAPTSRNGARLVFDEMRNAVVMYGGSVAGQDIPDGVMYMRVGTGWQPICTGTQPSSPVFLPGLAYNPANGDLILAGGFYTKDLSMVRMSVYACHQDNNWSPIGDLQHAVGGATLVRRGNEFVLIGGYDGVKELQGMQIATDPAGPWRFVDIPFKSSGAGTSATFSDHDNAIFALPGEVSNDMIKYDEIWTLPNDSDGWTNVCLGCSGKPRMNSSIIHVGNSPETYVVGGFGGFNQERAGTWILDQKSLVRVLDKPGARDSVGLTWNADDGHVVGFGGNGDSCPRPSQDCNETIELVER